VQQRGQPGAVAAGALHRPAAPRRVAGDLRAGELQQLPVAGGVGLVAVWARIPPTGLTAAAARVSRWVSTPMTPSTVSARMGMRLLLAEAAVVGVGLGASHRAAQL
jgi:hypothetical protein